RGDSGPEYYKPKRGEAVTARGAVNRRRERRASTAERVRGDRRTSNGGSAPRRTDRRPLSLPLDRRWRLRRDVGNDAVDPVDLVRDPPGDSREELLREIDPVGRHPVARLDDAKRDDVLVGPLVAHHSHGLDREEHREGLPDVRVVAIGANLLLDDRIGRAKDLEALARHLAENADREPGTGEGLAIDDLRGKAEL